MHPPPLAMDGDSSHFLFAAARGTANVTAESSDDTPEANAARSVVRG
jgi:hypothetical protein